MQVLEVQETRQVYYRQAIQAEDIYRLLNGEITAVRIPGYYSAAMCKVFADIIADNPMRGTYRNAPKIERVGQAFFECQVSKESRRVYDANAVRWMRTIRQSCEPFLSPIDRLRLELDEIWPSGAVLAALSNRKLFAGLARRFPKHSEAEPHVDVLSWDAPGELEAQLVSSQIAANVYLKVPEKGGELALWNFWPDQAEYEQKRIPGSYGLRDELLPSPSVIIDPEPGELIMFNSKRVHAVRSIEKGERVAWSCFIGHMNKRKPLIIWS